MDIVRIVDSVINVQDLYSEAHVESGAVSVFLENDKEKFNNCILWKENEVPDAQKVEMMSKICKSVRNKMSVSKIVILCGLNVSPGEPFIGVACSASNYLQASKALENIMHLIGCLGTNFDPDIKPVKIKATNVADSSKRCDIVSPHLIQVRANNEEIKLRINSFIERKREQINRENIRDFCSQRSGVDEGNSCARVDAVLVRRKDSKGHLRVRKVLNSWGPQTRSSSMSMKAPSDFPSEESGNDTKECFKSQPHSSGASHKNLLGVDERLRNIEEHIGISQNSVPADVYGRLKKIEDRILYLEGLSPEYAEFWGNISQKSSLDAGVRNPRKHTYSQTDITNKIQELQNKLMLKGK